MRHSRGARRSLWENRESNKTPFELFNPKIDIFDDLSNEKGNERLTTALC